MSSSRRSLRDACSRRRSSSSAQDKSDKSDSEKNAATAAPKTPTSSGGSSSGIRTRLSTGTLFMNGTCTMRDPGQPRQSDGEAAEKDTAAALSKKRQANEAAALPPPKRQKIGRNTGTGENNKNDYFCWVCHKEGPTGCCEVCPRVFHMRCLSIQGDLPANWVCPECEKIMRAEFVDTRSQAMSLINSDTLCQLLQYALQRMHHMNAGPFSKPVDLTQNPFYLDHIFNPMDLSTLEKNIKKKMYGCTEAFLADAKWILHNCIIYNGVLDRLTSAAKTIIKTCRHEMSEIEICPDCYTSSCEQEETYWFCQPCRKPHPLVWAKLKGYPYWPAKALREVDGMVDVRFFGAHDRSLIPSTSVMLLSHEVPNMIKKGRGGFKEAIKELDIHIKRLREQFGHFEYAPPRTPYSEKDRFKHVRPGSHSGPTSRVARMLKVEARAEDGSAGAAASSSAPLALRRLEGDKVGVGMKTVSGLKTSAATKTATAVKSKYIHLPNTPTKRPMALRQQGTDGKPRASSTATVSAPDKTAASEAEAATSSTAPKTFTPAGIFTASLEMETQPLTVQTHPSPGKITLRRRFSPTDVVEKIHDKIARIAQSEEDEEGSEPAAKIPRIKQEPLSGDEGNARKKTASGIQGSQSRTSDSLPNAGSSKATTDASAKNVEAAMDVADGMNNQTGFVRPASSSGLSSPPGSDADASLAKTWAAESTKEKSVGSCAMTSDGGATGAETAQVPDTSTEKSGVETSSGSQTVTESHDSAPVSLSSGVSLKMNVDVTATGKTDNQKTTTEGEVEMSGLVIASVSSQSLDEVVALDLLKQQTPTTQSSSSTGATSLARASTAAAGNPDAKKDSVPRPSAVGKTLGGPSPSQQKDGEDAKDDATSEPKPEKSSEGGSLDAAGPKTSGKETESEQETEPSTSGGSFHESGQSYYSKLMQTIASCKAQLGMSSDEDVELSLEYPSEDEEEEEVSILGEEDQSAELKKGDESAELKEKDESAELKEEDKSDKLNEGDESAELKEKDESPELKEEDKSAEWKEGKQSAELKEKDESAELKEEDKSAEWKEGKQSAELKEKDESAELKEEDKSAEWKEGKQSAELTPAEGERRIPEDAESSQIAKEANTDSSESNKASSEEKEMQDKIPDASDKNHDEAEKDATRTGTTAVSAAAETGAVAVESGSAEVNKDKLASAATNDEAPMEVDQESSALCRVEPGSVCSLAPQMKVSESVQMVSETELSSKAGSSIPCASSRPETEKSEGLQQVVPASAASVEPSNAEPVSAQPLQGTVELVPVKGSHGAVVVTEGGPSETPPVGYGGSPCAEKTGDGEEVVGEKETSLERRLHSSTVIQLLTGTAPKAISDKDVMAMDCAGIAENRSSPAKTLDPESGKTLSDESAEPARTSSRGEENSKGTPLAGQDSKMVSEEAEGDVVIVQEILATPKRKVEEEEKAKMASSHSQPQPESQELLKGKMPWTNKPKRPTPPAPATRGNVVPAAMRGLVPTTCMAQSQGVGGMPCLGLKMDSRSVMGPRYPSMTLPTRSPDSSGQMMQDNRGRQGGHMVSSTQPLPSCSASSMDSRIRTSTMDSATILKSMADLAKQTGTGQQDRGRHVEHCLPQDYSAMFNGTAYVCKYTTECARSIEKTLADMYHEVMSKTLPLQMEHFNKEVQRMRQQHLQEMEELRHNFTLTMMEAKQCWTAEMKKNLDSLIQQHMQEVQEVKRKQWCVQCGVEAMYHCCWNTSYCSEDCQRLHWSMHCHTCEQVQGAQGVAMEASQTAADSSTDCGPDSTHTPTGNQPMLTWSEKDEAMAAKSTFNLLPPKSSQPCTSVSMVSNSALFLQANSQQLQLQYLQPGQVRVPFQPASRGPGGHLLAPPGAPSSLMYPLLRPPSSQPLPPGGSNHRGQVLFSPGPVPPHASGMGQSQVSMVPRPQTYPYRPGF